MSATTAGEQGRRAGSAPGRRVVAAAPRQRATATAPRPATAPRQRTAPGRRVVAGVPHRPVLSVVPPLREVDDGPAVPVPAPRPAAEQRLRRTAPVPPTRASTRPRTRLTRRGRIVVSVLVVVATLLVVALAWLAGTATAQAARSGTPARDVYRNLTSVVVRPGESLWAIAMQAEPAADPRSVIQEIVDLNALGGTSIQPGQHLLVPRG
jgi:LysM domain